MSPQDEYRRRFTERHATAARLERTHIRLGNLRLALAGATVVAIVAAIRGAASPAWIAVPVIAFIAVAAQHTRVLRRQTLARRAARFYELGLLRLDDRWAGSGQRGERFDHADHVYAADLDLFGSGSLFELLCAARTRMGEDTLARWLQAPAPIDSLRERHEASRELTDLLDFRECLAVLGEDAAAGVHPDVLTAWAEGDTRLRPLSLRWLAPLFALAAVASLAVWIQFSVVTPLALVLGVEAFFSYRLRQPVAEILSGTDRAFSDVDLLTATIERFEAQPFRAARLRHLQQALVSGGRSAAAAMRRLRRIAALNESRANPMVRWFDAPLMYSVQVAFAANRWRAAHGRAVRAWLDAVGEIEALISLAAYRFERPDDPFPELATGDASIAADGVGHPLLPASRCVRNDVTLCASSPVWLVSGSNMSGKSTLLRAVGLNVVLAMAGGTVRARRLSLTPVQVGASIRINDSLQEGTSRFYAEITRLQRLFALTERPPTLLFLLDELLQGTNSRDRRSGADAVLKALVDRGALGLVTTHDLALAETDALHGRLVNVHFEDSLQDGRMTFDYKLIAGPITRSNGLALMRSVGLPV